MVSEGDAKDGELLWTYELVYGGESAAGIHAGFASVSGHLVDQPNWTGIAADRQEVGDGSGLLLWATPLLAMLARRVFKSFGVGVEELNRLGEPIYRLALGPNEAFSSGA